MRNRAFMFGTAILFLAGMMAVSGCKAPSSGSDDDSSFNSDSGGSGGGGNSGGGSGGGGDDQNSGNQTQMAVIKGRVWAPGGDDPNVMPENRFPVPHALVFAWPTTNQLPDIPDQSYCHKCEEISSAIPQAFTGADGSFEIAVYPNTEYYLVVQKGEFRRVTTITTPGPGEVMDLTASRDAPTPSMVTLPNRHSPSNGMWMPRILVIEGDYEVMDAMFNALGFDYGEDAGNRVRVLRPEEDTWGMDYKNTEAENVLKDYSRLKQYHLVVASCGAEPEILLDPQVQQNLKRYVQEGGKLYIDDFSYDFVEQPWPEFLVFNDGSSTCGSGSSAPSEIGVCNHWSSYDPLGTPGDPDLEQWLNNPDVLSDEDRDGSKVRLYLAYDIIESMNPGPQGECSDLEDPHCQNGVYVAPPKVWMYGDWSGYTHQPITVSWLDGCGKVLYTVYHTHSGGGEGEGYSYSLLPQEKIMMYLIMEIQACTEPVVVE